MPFRERVKRAFGSRPSLGADSDSSGSSPPTTTLAASARPPTHRTRPAAPTSDPSAAAAVSHISAATGLQLTHRASQGRRSGSRPPKPKRSKKAPADAYADWPEHIYKPHEMPPPKYRRPPDARHAARLNAYDLGAAARRPPGRRNSDASVYSPRGSRFCTRLPSFVGGEAAPTEPLEPAEDVPVGGAAEPMEGVELTGAAPRSTRSRKPSTRAMEETWDHEHSYLTSSISHARPSAPAPARSAATTSLSPPPPGRRGHVVGADAPAALAHLPPLSTSPGSSASDSDPLGDAVETPPPGAALLAPPPPPPPVAPGVGGTGGCRGTDKSLPPVPAARGRHSPLLKLPSVAPGKPFSGEDLMHALARSGLDLESMDFRSGDW